MGLLRPDRIDPDSSYRYYRESQLENARLISFLRKLDAPLAEIAEIIELAPEDASARLDSWWQRGEEEMERRRELLAFIRSNMLGDTSVQQTAAEAVQVSIRSVPETSYLYVSRHITGPDLPEYIGRSGYVLRQRAERYGGATGPVTVVYHGLVDMDSDGPADVCVPISSGHTPLDDDSIRTESSHFQAFTRLMKRQVQFPQILQVYQSVRLWIEHEGHEISGPPREMYLGDYEIAAESDPICDIAFPIRLAQGE